ncbi:hypothetical protein Mth01_25180 [Sphaerimonospora thailandensis]|uniref:DUF309 domain-containing protein n=1 Tax=Sphaerimonospora thailandensis TaxID=795644 RepID=A0A8J3VZM9_9ACTN|nr:hypothetical protein Mth01_25180 [Sphaerimonospora thailandensis]
MPRVPDDYSPGARQAIEEARRLLAVERPFHAHEVLEARWKTGPAEERELWQGLAQICVGLTHVQRGNLSGAAALLLRGSARLGGYGSRRPYGLDLRALELAADRVITALDSGGIAASTAINVILGHLQDTEGARPGQPD